MTDLPHPVVNGVQVGVVAIDYLRTWDRYMAHCGRCDDLTVNASLADLILWAEEHSCIHEDEDEASG
jgi:hypothetical protein